MAFERRMIMKRKTIIISFICILSAVIIVMVTAVFRGRKPYKNLDSSKIVSATVRLTPPDKTIQITEVTELVNLLKDVVIYNEDNSYTSMYWRKKKLFQLF